MKSYMRFVVVGLVWLGATAAQAQRSGTGAGVIVGEPTGLSLKHWVAADRAFDAAAAWSLEGNDSLQLHADYLFHNFSALKEDIPEQSTAVYYGLGARVCFHEDNGRGHDDNDTTLGVRIPVGLDFFPAKSPIDIFLEIVPVLEVAPSTEFDLDAALGARFFFN